MGVRDALLLNLTGSNFQALQSNETARVKGDLSFQKDDGTEVLGIDVSAATLNLTGGITGSGNISSSLSSTGSFGRVVATTFHGDGSALKNTLPRSANIVTASAQLSAQISGAFTAGFEYSASISGSATSTGSFGRVEGVEFHGDGSGIKTTLPRSTGIVTSSAQLASRISGSFNKGFGFGGAVVTSLFYTGVSGSVSASRGAESSSQYGSDYTHLLEFDKQGQIRGSVIDGTWSAGGALSKGAGYHSQFGTQNASIITNMASGSISPYNSNRAQQYNGTSWEDISNINVARSSGRGVGTAHAGVIFSGYNNCTCTETWNGQNWSVATAAPYGAHNSGHFGTQNAATFVGGRTGTNCHQNFNGQDWAIGPNLIRSAWNVGSGGLQNSGLIFGTGAGTWNGTCTDEFDGSAWSAGGALINPAHANTGAGTQNSAWSRHCAPNSQNAGATTEFYNGTSWSAGPLGLIDSYAAGGSGTTTAGLLAGGNSHPYTPGHYNTCTEEFTGLSNTTGSFGRLDATTITGDATPIINSLPFPSGLVSGSGILASDISGSFNKGFGLSGNITTPMDAWSTGHDMNVGRWYFGAKGYVDAAIAMGGRSTNPASEQNDETELWDGTTWSEVNDMSYGRTGGYGGTVESGYFSGGQTAPWARTEEWNGTNWSEAPNLGEYTGDVGGCSPTQVYGIGSVYDGGQKFVKYNAGVCTEGPILSIGTCAPFGYRGSANRFGHAGNADCLLVFTCHFTEEYNGSSWSVLSHNTGEFDGTYQGFTDSNPNPAKLNGVCNKACSVRNNTGAGTTNDAYSYGGEVGPNVGPGWYAKCSRAMFQRWDGVSWSRGVEPPVFCVDSAQGIGDGANAFVLGGKVYPGQAPHASIVYTSGSIFLEGQSSASFGLLQADKFSGNAASLQSQLPYSTNPSFNVLTGSSQIASDISGSFNKGFEFTGQIKAAVGGVFSLGTSMLEQQTGATGGSMNKGTAFVAGGSYGSSRETCACHQQYNGTSWAEAADLNNARTYNLYAAGDSSAAVVHGGTTPGPLTEEWNGTAWIAVTNFHPARNVNGETMGAGQSSEAAMRINLYDAAEWNGSAWSEIDTTTDSGLTGGHYNAFGTGTTEATMQFGGQSPHNFSSTGYDRSLRATREYNGSAWSECANMIFQQYHGNAFGSANDAVATGGLYYRRAHDRAPAPFGGFSQYPLGTGVPGTCTTQHSQYWNGSTWSVTGRLLCRVKGCGDGGSGYGGASGGGASNQGFIAGGATPGSPYNTDAVQLFDTVKVSGSFGRIDATTFHGDGSGLTNILPSGLVSASAQLGISGSFTSGFGFSGEISGSATSTGSFGRIEAGFLHGDGSSIKDNLSRSTGLVSSSAQIAANISGSFTSGFGYDGLIQTTPGGTWSAGGNLTRTAGFGTTGMAGTGTKNAALVAGGRSSALTEEYNGTSFSEVNDLIQQRQTATMTGTTEASILFGGSTSAAVGGTSVLTETWDGSSWTEVNDMSQVRWFHGKLGITSEAAKAIGGEKPSPTASTDSVEDWNGSNWSEGTDLPAALYSVTSTGTSDSGIVMAWPSTETYCWNGSSWSDVATRALARYQLSGVAGTSNDAFIAGGRSPGVASPQYTDCVELFNGTTWSSGPNLPLGREMVGSVDSLNTGIGAGMIVGGAKAASPNYLVDSLEYSNNITSASFHNIEVPNLTGDGSRFSASLQTQILTSAIQISNSISGSFTGGFDLQGGVSASFGLFGGGTWRSGGTLNNAGYWGVAVGHENAALQLGGAGRTQKTEEYNGIVWSEVTDTINSHGTGGDLGAAGTTEGSVLATSAGVEIWNGSNWSEATATLPSGAATGIGSGGVSQNAGLFFLSGHNDEWNGISFTERANINNNRSLFASSGQSTEAAIIAGGNEPASGATPTGRYTEIFDGTSWTEVADLINGRQYGEGAGHTNHFLMIGGAHTNSNLSDGNVEIFNGSAWSVTGNLITHVRVNAATGGGSDIAGGCGALTIGGASPGGGSTKTEHFVSDTSGSFGQLRGTVGGEIKTDMFNITSSTFKLPIFSDRDLNYNSKEPQESTGSISGSVVRAGDVNVLNRPGNFFLHSDYNALGFTYVSSSVYSQSVDFVTCGYVSASVYTSSQGFITQSHYCYQNVIQYITGSYT